jgi:hypothetical protein
MKKLYIPPQTLAVKSVISHAVNFNTQAQA